MKKVKFLYDKVMEITEQVGKDHVGAYAAQAAYFFMLSLIPLHSGQPGKVYWH